MLEGKKAGFFSCRCAQIKIKMNENRVKWDDEDQHVFESLSVCTNGCSGVKEMKFMVTWHLPLFPVV